MRQGRTLEPLIRVCKAVACLSLLATAPGALHAAHELSMGVLMESDFVCGMGRYFEPFVWDGWRGRLELYPGGTGQLTSGGMTFAVRHTVAHNPQDLIEGLQGPGFTDSDTPSYSNHRLVFSVDFNQTPDNGSDDQRFDGYMVPAYEPKYTGERKGRWHIGGITWWEGLPFAFYSVQPSEYIYSPNGAIKDIVPVNTCL